MTESPKIIQVSTFRPEKCGIASWTEDTINYCHGQDPQLRNRVLAVNGFRRPSEYTDFVDLCIERDNLEDYINAAEWINNDEDIKLVSIQHEFGIFGGKMGDFVLPFLDAIKKPKLITLHTVPKNAEDDGNYSKKKKVLKEVISKADQLMVISETAKKILLEEYQVNSDKLNVILHGVHDFEETTEHSKKVLGLENKFVLSTVGLVRKKRGFEHVIESLSSLVEKHPNIKYVLAGSTHPKEFEGNKEPYRDFLEWNVRRLGLKDNVKFVNKYLTLNSLLRHINASDVCITPYTDPRQISSGVLSYGVGLGKPTIATPFLYAQEILGEGRGIVLPDFNNPQSMSNAIKELIENPDKIREIKENMKPIREKMRWPNVAQKYIDVEKKMINNS